jgi:hypothetical protein
MVMGRIRKFLIPGVDKRLLVKDATKIMPDPVRRRFIAGGASLGALTLLTGCDVFDGTSAENMLTEISKFNDAVQAWMFNPDVLAPTYPESAITKPFPFNGYYELDDAPEVDGRDWKFEVKGLVENKKSWTLEELYKLPQVKQVTRRSGAGAELRCATSSSWSAPTRAPNIAGSSAQTRRATTLPSTCAPRCTRRHR